ncbi:class I adenylate-forming enzyme family protein [Aquicoccus sp.]|uniref:class I adenylate-forming enzyme family protein n=1 Tax=Aquicoccus sp. TaxID=2055851 RepID=UPI00356A14AE
MHSPLSETSRSGTDSPPGSDGLDWEENVPSLLARQARDRGTALALSAMSQGLGRHRLTYSELHGAAGAAAAWLRQSGLKAGDRLGIYLTNDWALECFVAALGALTLGAVAVPLNTRSAAPELGHAIALTTPRLVLCDASGHERLIEGCQVACRAEPDFDDAMPIILDPAPLANPTAQEATPIIEQQPSVDALGCLLFTSGTTARAKAVMHTHRTMIATGRCTGAALGLRSDDIYQGAFPFFTSSALNLAGMSCWVAGAGLVIEGQIGNEARLDLVRDEGTTLYHGVPSILNFMTQAHDPARHDLTGLRMVANGGASMPVELTERIAHLWPWVQQVQIYGMTESGPAGTVLPPERMQQKAGSVGRAMEGMTIEILDDDAQPLATGELGEIALSGAPVAVGYFRNPDATENSFHGRRIRTGDVGRLDPDGYLWFGDRKKDLINRGGLKIASVAVETVLYRHPDVLEAAVVAVPHPDLGEDVAAVVTLRPGATPEGISVGLKELCRNALADYEVPRNIFICENLPRNPMGKILKGELRRNLQKCLNRDGT